MEIIDTAIKRVDGMVQVALQFIAIAQRFVRVRLPQVVIVVHRQL